MGELMISGRNSGVVPDYADADRWLRIAAMQGDADAQLNLPLRTGLEGKEIPSPSGRGRKMSLTRPLIDQAITLTTSVPGVVGVKAILRQVCRGLPAVTSPKEELKLQGPQEVQYSLLITRC
jgi:TPR repeat protein